jgi:hypothetical protein
MSAPSARVLTFAAEEVPKALNCQLFAEALSSAAQTCGRQRRTDCGIAKKGIIL